MSKLLIRNGSVYTGGSFEKLDILCDSGRITALGVNLNAEGAEMIDAAGLRAVPGFIDLHTHGSDGVDVNDAGVEGYRKIARFFASQGVTAFHASVLTDTVETTDRCLDEISEVMRDRGRGAQLLGAHLEGPFLAPEYKGAMPEHLLQKKNIPLLMHYVEEHPGVVRYITISPEIDGGIELIGEAAKHMVVAIGHSGADYATACAALAAGASASTHTFNAMRLFHQHEPAIMGAVLESDCLCEAICDGLHLAPGTVRMLLKCKGFDHVVGVTDSIMAAGLPDGQYKLGVNDVTVINGDARLTHGNARAGSTLTMIRALRNLMRFTGRPMEDVLPIITANPARLMRIDDRKGTIGIGKDADITLLDENTEVVHTISLGDIVYSR